MTRIALVSGGDWHGILGDYDKFVGVDRGSLRLLEQGYPLDMAVGDFDSVSLEEFEKIGRVAKEVLQSPAEKDDTDTELALKETFLRFPNAEVSVFGAFGGRLDHLVSNLFLPSHPDLTAYMSQISLIDAQNHVIFRPRGKHRLKELPEMTYISFMPEGGQLYISGAKYPMDESNFFTRKSYGSNEFIKGFIDIDVLADYVVIIYSKDRR